MRAVAFRSGATVVGAELVQTGQPPSPTAWVIKGKANRVLMEAGTPVTLPGGIVATVTQGNPGPAAPRMGTLSCQEVRLQDVLTVCCCRHAA